MANELAEKEADALSRAPPSELKSRAESRAKPSEIAASDIASRKGGDQPPVVNEEVKVDNVVNTREDPSDNES
jgi:hypothetical protein